MKERKIMARTFEKGTPEWEAWRAKISASKKGNSPAPNKGIPHSEETRQKIKEARAKQIFTSDRNARISATMKAKYAQGDIVSPESRANAAAKLRGRPMHPHAKAALRAANVGSKHSEEHKARIAESSKKALQNPEVRAKIAQASKGRTQSAETRAKRSALMKAKHAQGNYVSPEARARAGLKHRGKTLSPETRAKISASLTGRKYPRIGLKPTENRTEKRCSVCKEIKPLSDFYRDKNHADGASSTCIVCDNTRNKLRYKNERTKYLEILAQRKLNTTDSQMTFIYALIDPETNEIRYIGKSNLPKQRYNAHLRETSKNDKTRWIASLKSRGLKPILQILEVVSLELWEVRECYWIAHYREQGYNLTNTRDGGGGTAHMAREIARKISTKLKGYSKQK